MKRADRPRRPISTVRPAGPSRSRMRLAAWRGRTRLCGAGATLVLSVLPCSLIIDPAQTTDVLAWMTGAHRDGSRSAMVDRRRCAALGRLAAVAVGVAFGEFGTEQEDLHRIIDP